MNQQNTSSILSVLRNHSSLVKFGIVGVSATVVHYIAANLAFNFSLFSQGEKGELFCNIIGYISGFVISYLGNRYWSFSEQASGLSMKRSLSRFLLAWVLGFGVNQGLFYISSAIFGWPFNLSITCGVIVAAVFTYLCNKYFVFK